MTTQMESQGKDAHRNEQGQKYDELMTILGNSAVEQEKILARILSTNAETEYLRQYKLNGATDAKTFKAKVPVSDYENYKPFMDRLFEGEKSPMLTAYPVTQIWTSSGTSKGMPKMFPGTEEELLHRAGVMNYGDAVMARSWPELLSGKVLLFFNIRKSTISTGGLPCHPISSASLNSQAFRELRKTKLIPTSPPAALLADNFDEGMYCHMLLGLVQREEVGRIAAFFPTTLLKAMRFLEQSWQQICKDIADGTLSTIHVKEEKLRSAVEPILEKRPDLAFSLEKVFVASKSWNGIMQKLWPHVKAIDTGASGTMKPYFSALKEYAGQVPIICSGMYVSTEGSHGLNLDVKRPGNEVCYNLFPGSAFYEFIAVEDDGPNPEILDLVNLREGREYVILITALSAMEILTAIAWYATMIQGMCRYRIGDVLKVVGHINSNPTLQLRRRPSVILSVDMDKTNEDELQKAVERGSQLLQSELGWRLVDYTSTTDYESNPGHYIIIWELDSASTESMLSWKESASSTHQQVLEKCCAEMEAALGRIYKRGRQENLVGALELCILQSGTFDCFCDDAVSRGASRGQIKIPRGLAPLSPSLRVILDHVIHSAVIKAKPTL